MYFDRRVLALVDAAADRERYVVQEGIESLRHEGAVFDVRVVMVHDGRGWNALLETRLARADCELSNVFQGGTIHVTHELLESTVGERDSRVIEERLMRTSHGLAACLETRFPARCRRSDSTSYSIGTESPISSR